MVVGLRPNECPALMVVVGLRRNEMPGSMMRIDLRQAERHNDEHV